MTISLAMDVLIVILLAATIFYALRLSRHLDAFRSNRSDMERLIRDLSAQITRAQEGISTLDELAKESSDELRALVAKATGLSDELQLMTEAGDNMAGRLETLATRNRIIADDMSHTAVNLVYPGSKQAPSQPFAAKKDDAPAQVGSKFFAIRDPDFLPEDDENEGEDVEDNSDEEDDDDDRLLSEPHQYETQSERDLAAALRRRREKSQG